MRDGLTSMKRGSRINGDPIIYVDPTRLAFLAHKYGRFVDPTQDDDERELQAEWEDAKKKMLIRRMEDAIQNAGLSDRQRQIVQMVRDVKSVAQIARELAISRFAVNGLRRRAIVRMRKYVARHFCRIYRGTENLFVCSPTSEHGGPEPIVKTADGGR